jgi:hypothetical protein
MAAPNRKLTYVPMTYWAVGRTKNASLVALQLNDETPVVLRVKEAKEIAAALQNEADMIAKQDPDRENR